MQFTRIVVRALLAFTLVSNALSAADDRVVYEGTEGPGRGKHIVFVSGDEEYHSEEALPMLAKILARHHGFKCTVLFAIDPETGIINPRVRDNIPGLETLEKADAMVIFTRWRILPDEQTKFIADFVETGKPIIGLRTATHPIAPPTKAHEMMRRWMGMKKRNPDKAGPRPVIPPELLGPYGHLGDGYWGPNKKWTGGFGKFIIGEKWVAHHGRHKHESTRGFIAPGAESHPVTRGIKDGEIWGSTDVYTIDLPLPGDSKPLVLGQVVKRKGEYNKDDVDFGMRPSDTEPVAEKNDPMMPIAWTKSYQDDGGEKGRVFATTMGSSADLANAALRKLVVNGVYWAFDLANLIPENGTKVDLVGDYKPSQYGFATDEYWKKRNLKPSDLAGLELTAPTGFTALFNGKDLKDWRGGWTFDHRQFLDMSKEDRAKQIKDWTTDMLEHWSIEGDELVNDGHGKYATTRKDYGDFELLIEYKTVPKADSGIYLRGVPQVQIWDSNENDERAKRLGKPLGSGGLWNNNPGSPGKDPLVKADKPLGQWNKFRIVMVGSRVSVWMNNKLIVDHATMHNYYDRRNKEYKNNLRPVPKRGPIELQTHGGEIRWRNIFIREIGTEEANQILADGDATDGFKSVFNGKDLSGWAGASDNYEVVQGAIRCKKGKGGNLFTEQEYGDFVATLEFKLPPGGNNGLAIRYPGKGNPAYDGMTELQVLDSFHSKYQRPGREINAFQYHGSAYSMVAAHTGYLRNTGDWNYQKVTVKGSTIQVELNGAIILDTDLSKVKADKKRHKGKDLKKGHFGFAGHSDPVAFRNIRIKSLD